MGLDMYAMAVKFIDGHDEPQVDANLPIEVESALLRQAFEVHQEALLQTLMDLHTQQVAQMRAGLSEQLLDMAVEYRK